MDNNISFADKLLLFEEMSHIGTSLSLWRYAMDGHLTYTNSPHLVLDKFFENSGCKSYMLEYAHAYRSPLILSGPLGLMWSAVFLHQNDEPYEFFVIGPVFHSEVSGEAMEDFAHRIRLDLSWRSDFLEMMKNLPVLSSILFFQYTLILHYIVNGEMLDRSSLHFQKNMLSDPPDNASSPANNRDRRQTWMAEREVLSMIREGNLNYHAALNRAGMLSSGVRVENNASPTMKALISCATFTSLCTREAILAGISPDTAYTVGDTYIRNMMEAKTISEMASLNHAMYEDFIQRVRKHKLSPHFSLPVRQCIEYIDMHTKDELSLPLLARHVGYSEFHLSRKFKQETGSNLSYYIQESRIRQAEHDLAFTNLSIGMIADSLHFSSSSHFSSVFQKFTEMTPHDYRQKHNQLG